MLESHVQMYLDVNYTPIDFDRRIMYIMIVHLGRPHGAHVAEIHLLPHDELQKP